MKILIIDADLIGRKRHRFPNLACMKISGYYKSQGHNVQLVTDYNILKNIEYDKIFISKVFTDTKIPEWVLILPFVVCGGTGFYYDKAPMLNYEIEHHKPDYHLYDDWVSTQLNDERHKQSDFKYYTDYSIGFTTRGCFRKCDFCVNKNYDKVIIHSPLEEFIDIDKPYVCLLDDNILGFGQWQQVLKSLKQYDKRFEFKQGMDIRLMTEEKAKILSESKYVGDYIFAFDNIKDKDLIENKLDLWRKYCNKTTKLYVFCAFDRNNIYDYNFWIQDIKDVFERIKILMKYKCIPYIMRFEKVKDSPFYGTYVNIASWCNQPNMFKKKSYREWCISDNLRKGGNSATMKYVDTLINTISLIEPEQLSIIQEYFDLKYENNACINKN